MNSLVEQLKRLCRRPTPAEVAAREMALAELDKLSAQTAVEYAQSVVAYNDARIRRLRKFLAEQCNDAN